MSQKNTFVNLWEGGVAVFPYPLNNFFPETKFVNVEAVKKSNFKQYSHFRVIWNC